MYLLLSSVFSFSTVTGGSISSIADRITSRRRDYYCPFGIYLFSQINIFTFIKSSRTVVFNTNPISNKLAVKMSLRVLHMCHSEISSGRSIDQSSSFSPFCHHLSIYSVSLHSRMSISHLLRPHHSGFTQRLLVHIRSIAIHIAIKDNIN